MSAEFQYPAARRGDDASVLHGVTVPDPYRWLEDPDSPETQAWVEAQGKVTGAYFSAFAEDTRRARARLEQLQNYERVSTPFRRGKYVYLYRNPTGLLNQDLLVQLPAAVADAAASPAVFDSARVFLDLNKQYPDGTTALGATAFSEDGRWFAYGLSHGGSDWQSLRIRDTETGEDLPEVIPWVKFSSITWMHDGSGFFYSRFPAPPEVAAVDGAPTDGASKAGTEVSATTHCMVWFHAVGTPVTEDLLVYANPDQAVWMYGTEITDDGEYLLLSTHRGTDPVNRLYYAHLPSVWPAFRAATAPYALALGAKPPAHGAYPYLPLVPLINNFEAKFDYIANDGARFLLMTNLSAPKYRLVSVWLTHPACAAEHSAALATDVEAPVPPLFEVVPEATKDVLQWATVADGNKLLLCYLADVVNKVQVHVLPPVAAAPSFAAADAAATAAGELLPAPLTSLALPGPGTVAGMSSRRNQPLAFLKFVSFLQPGNILRVAFGADGTPATSAWYDVSLPGFDASAFEARQVFVPSTDGKVKVPVFIVRRVGGRDAGAPAAPAPTLLYGYGGFSVSLQPTFSALRLLWLSEYRGTYAMACLRGGAEYGEEWHEAGCRLNKQNVFDDLHAVAGWLIEHGYTTSPQLGIMGGSNGGLLTLASMLQRPGLYGAVVSQVPVTDMMRFHKFSVGALWRGDYGYVEDDAADFKAALAYSPLHNVPPAVEAGQPLPATLITTADHDDRVSPLHSYKMAATLQAGPGACAAQTRPLLVRIETKAGHGAGKPVSKVLDEYADVWSFLARELGAHYTEAQ